MGTSALVIHSDERTTGRLSSILSQAGWTVHTARCREHASELPLSRTPTAILAQASGVIGDLPLLCASLREQFPGSVIVALVGRDTDLPEPTRAEGLDDYLREPFAETEVLETVNRLLLLTEGPTWPAAPNVAQWPSPATRRLLEQAARLASHEGTVLLLGESGSGKDYIARWIHEHSPRRLGPFFTINCAALSRELAESELFGHEPGAFTGTKGRKRGLLELAERGTLLLDEVGELDPSLQAKLLTFFDSRTFVRVGGERHIAVSARILAATNRDLLEEVGRGVFRRDLYYRLAVAPLHVPPLRERLEDFPLLVSELLSALRSELGLSEQPELRADALERLVDYDWPGNVRELRNVLGRAIMLSGQHILGPDELALPRHQGDWQLQVRFPEPGTTLHDLTREVARRVVAEALRRAPSKQEAARLLGISRHALAHQIRVLGLHDPDSSVPLASAITARPTQRVG